MSQKTNDKLVDFQCPYCGSMLSFSEAYLGTAQECPHCSETIVVSASGTGGKLPLPIETPRLRIRHLRTEDLPDWLEFVQDEKSYTYLGHHAPDDEEAKDWLENGKNLRLAGPKGYLALGVELEAEAKLIGHLSLYLYDPDEHRQGGFHIMIHPSYRGKGYGTEAVLGVIDFAVNGIALHDLRVSVDNRNIAARRMVEKAGMKLEGEFVEDSRVKGEWISRLCYVTLSRCWRTRSEL